MDMNATEIAAYLGASAWVPQILGWAYKAFTKPVITITPDKTAQIGYTTFGPIFNLRLSINTERKDALIDFMGVELKHKDGTTHEFEWAGMNEYFSEVKNNQGDSQVVQRDTMPITIKVSTLSPAERFFRFRETSFIESIQPIIDKISEELIFLQKSDDNFHDKLLASKAIDTYLKQMRESFWWKAGEYSCKFIIRSPSKIVLNSHSFKFNLTQDNIDALNKNLDEVKVAVEWILKNGLPNYQGKNVSWNWINPTIKS